MTDTNSASGDRARELQQSRITTNVGGLNYELYL